MKLQYRKHFFYFVYLFLFTFSLYSQSIQWAQNMGKNLGYTVGNSITNDKYNNSFSVGTYNNSFDINSGIDTCTLINHGGDDFFILKSNTYGNFIWAKGIGGKRNETPHCVTTDDSGNVYISGTFQDTVDFNPGTDINILSAVGTNIFVLKFNSNGEFNWAKNIPVGNTYSHTSLVIDKNGDVIISGSFLITTDFDPGIGVYDMQPTNNSSTLFILKLNHQGDFIFAKKIGIGNSYGMCLDTSGNIYTTGTFDTTSDFDPDTTVYNLIRTAANTSYILKLNNNGNLLWVKGTAGQTSSISVDDSNNVYSIGTFRNKVYFNPNNPNDTFVSLGYTDFFILKLSLNGNYVWVDVFGGTLSEYALSINLDNLGNIYTIGSFGDVVDFDPGIGIVNYTSNTNGSDIFLLKLTSNGQFVNMIKMGGYGTDMGNDITINNNNSVVITGYIASTRPDFDSIPNKFFLNVIGVEDVFIAKFSDCNLHVAKQPINNTIKAGINTFFNTVSSSATSTFQWQYLTKMGFANINNNGQFVGANTDSFKIINASQNLDNYKFRCVINDNGCSTFTDTVTLKVNCNFIILKQPSTQITSIDKPAVFFIQLNNNIVEKQWQKRSDMAFVNLIDDSNSVGSKNDSFIIRKAMLNQNNSVFRCVSTLDNCSLISDTVSLLVKCDKLIKSQPVNKSIKPGDSIIYVVSPYSHSSTFQWQIGGIYSDVFSNLNVSPNIKGVQDDSLIVSNVYPLMNNTEAFRCIVSERGCLDTSSIVAIYFLGNNELVSQSFSVFPNPISNTLTIVNDYSKSGVNYYVTDIVGSEVMSGNINTNNTLLDFTAMKNGIYILSISDEYHTRIKIIKE